MSATHVHPVPLGTHLHLPAPVEEPPSQAIASSSFGIGIALLFVAVCGLVLFAERVEPRTRALRDAMGQAR